MARVLWLALWPTLLLGGCAAVGPDYETPEAPAFVPETLRGGDGTSAGAAGARMGDSEAGAGGSGTAEDALAEPAHDWWRTLEDATLTGLVERALAENRDLRAAEANVTAARALARLEQSNRRPQGELNAAYERRRLAGAAFGLDDVTFPDTDLYNVGGALSWELDFFGRVRRGVEAAVADAGNAEALRRDAQVLVAAETVRAYTDYRGAQLQLAVAQRNLAVQRESLDLTVARYEEGLGTQLDVARARAQAQTTEASIPPLEAAAEAAANRLATLTVQPVGDVLAALGGMRGMLPTPPQAIAIGDPASLIERRADVRAAERTLHAATARIGLAKADYFPRISLTGSIAATTEQFSGLTEETALGYGIGPRLVWSGFDLPRVRAQVEAAGARAEAAYASWEQTILLALEETQSALAAWGRERVRYAALLDAVASTREASALARVRYDGGADDFLDVLDAEGRQLTAEAALAESAVAVTRRWADVYRALGAGWSL